MYFVMKSTQNNGANFKNEKKRDGKKTKSMRNCFHISNEVIKCTQIVTMNMKIETKHNCISIPNQRHEIRSS